MNKVYLVFLAYDIMFNDSDNGDCWAGDGKLDLKLFDNEEKAQNFITKYKDIFSGAFKEGKRQIFPRLENQTILYEEFGIDLHSVCQDMEETKLNYKVLKVE